jgi:glycosyltransferase involved in cell wall biosynthesis
MAKQGKSIVMLGTSLATKGGIASVVQVYVDTGLFQRFPVRYIATHRDGGAAAKLDAMVRAYLSLLWMLLRGKVALMHVHVASRASFWRKCGMLLLGRLFRVPSIVHLHGGGFQVFYEKECGPARRWLIRNIYDNASRIVVLSGQWETWVRGMTRNKNVTSLYNPVAVSDTVPDWASRDRASVLMLGRLNRGKGAYDLVKAAATMPPGQAALRLKLGGDGEVEQVGAAARSAGIGDRVDLLGWVGPEDKARYLATATVFTLPSYHEGLPMSVLEAMAAGLPVVTTPVGGIPEAVTDGVEGFLVAPGDTAALADRLGRLLADPGLAERMGQAGRRKVESTFAHSIIMPRLERMYMELGAVPTQQPGIAAPLARAHAAE